MAKKRWTNEQLAAVMEAANVDKLSTRGAARNT